jgi:hypothetical protein
VSAPQESTPAQPASAEPAAETKTAPGPVPYERFREVNERAKTAEARTRAIEAEVLQPMSTDPVGWLVDSFAEVLNDPRYASDPRLKSFAGRQLSGRAATTTAQPTPEAAEDVAMPEIAPLVDSAGNKVYAAEDVMALLSWQEQKLLGKVKQELAPLEEIQTERAYAKQHAKAVEVASKVVGKAKSIMEAYRKAPGWTKEIEPAVKARFNELRQAGEEDPTHAMSLAYQQIVVPTLGQKERQAVVTSLQNKQQASTVTARGPTAPAKGGVVDTRAIAAQVFAEAGT